MSFPGSHQFAAGMRSDAVSNATGRGWQEWFNLLDRAGAKALPHSEIEQYLHDHQGLSGWWSRMVTFGYEEACGRRADTFRDKSFTIKVSRTFDTAVDSLFKAWADEVIRSRWLADHPILIRKAIPNRTMRINWSDGISGLIVDFQDAGPGKSGLIVRHVNLSDKSQAQIQEAFWQSALSRLAEALAEGH